MTICDLRNILTSTEFEAFITSLDSLLQEYKKASTLSIEFLKPILGNPPRIPQSPDMDAMLDAYEDRAKYGKKANSIEEYLSCQLSA